MTGWEVDMGFMARAKRAIREDRPLSIGDAALALERLGESRVRIDANPETDREWLDLIADTRFLGVRIDPYPDPDGRIYIIPE